MLISDVALRSDWSRIPSYNFMGLEVPPSNHCSFKEAVVNSAHSLLLLFDLRYVKRAVCCTLFPN